jgi:8-oxo-dGTP diphosphatase
VSLEELGIETYVGDVLAESEYHYDHGAIRLVAMKTTVVAGELCLTVHDRFEWVRPEDLESFPLAPADIPIAQRLRVLL